MLSAGFFRKWWMEMNVNNNVCDALETAPIELRTIVTPFIVLGLGVLVALGVLASECLFSRRGWIVPRGNLLGAESAAEMR